MCNIIDTANLSTLLPIPTRMAMLEDFWVSVILWFLRGFFVGWLKLPYGKTWGYQRLKATSGQSPDTNDQSLFVGKNWQEIHTLCYDKKILINVYL